MRTVDDENANEYYRMLNMSKTVTIRLDEDTYQLIRQAARGQLRSISNFIEYATLSYVAEEASVSEIGRGSRVTEELHLLRMGGAR